MSSIKNAEPAIIVANPFKQRCLYLSADRLKYQIDLHDFNYLQAIRVALLLLFQHKNGLLVLVAIIEDITE